MISRTTGRGRGRGRGLAAPAATTSAAGPQTSESDLTSAVSAPKPWPLTRPILALAFALALSGCTRFENVMASIPVFSFLRNAPSFDPYEAPRPAPPGSVPFLSPAGDVPIGLVSTEPALVAFGATARNPLSPADTAALNRGKEMFDRHCMVCHGTEGKGDGPVVNKPGTTGKFPFAPNLTLPFTVARTDGYIYGVIAVGRNLMPPYGPRMTNLERWATVLYVRQLQRAAGAVPAAAPAPAPAQRR